MSLQGGKVMAGLLGIVLACWLVTDFAEARRGGGMRGGGMRAMRGGPAASGSFNRSMVQPSRNSSFTRPSRNSDYTRPSRDISSNTLDRDRFSDRQDDRQEYRSDRQEDRQDYRDDRYDRIEDHYEDRRDWYEDRWRVGAFLSMAAWNRMSCPYTTVIVDTITYYECYGTRYERVYRGSEVTYIIVN